MSDNDYQSGGLRKYHLSPKQRKRRIRWFEAACLLIAAACGGYAIWRWG